MISSTLLFPAHCIVASNRGFFAIFKGTPQSPRSLLELYSSLLFSTKSLLALVPDGHLCLNLFNSSISCKDLGPELLLLVSFTSVGYRRFSQTCIILSNSKPHYFRHLYFYDLALLTSCLAFTTIYHLLSTSLFHYRSAGTISSHLHLVSTWSAT